jgi:hypothetical protein
MTMKNARVIFCVVCMGLSTAACVRGSKGVTSEDKERLAQYIHEKAPSNITHPLDVNFDDKVHLIGYSFSPELAKPGEDVKITYFWRCDDKVDAGWLLFTHLTDEHANKSDNLDWAGPLREARDGKQLFGPDKWEKGKFYTEEQTYKMPDWITGPELAVYVGLWRGDQRMRVKSGPQDGDNRARMGAIKTGVTPADNFPQMVVNHLAPGEKIVIDGKADDAAWKTAASTGAFVDVSTGKANSPFPVQGQAKMTWDEENLYVLAEITDPDVVGFFKTAKEQSGSWTTTGQPKLWTKDTFEMMVDPDGDGDNKDYYELQINPQNKVFKSQFDALQQPAAKGDDGPFGHEEWNPKLKSAVVVKGTLDKSDDKDEGYTVEIAIPWAAYEKAKNHPPKSGDSWRVNFYAMQNNGGTSWSPILGQGNFHKASRFGKVTFMAPEGAQAAARGADTDHGTDPAKAAPKAGVQAAPANPADKAPTGTAAAAAPQGPKPANGTAQAKTAAPKTDKVPAPKPAP